MTKEQKEAIKTMQHWIEYEKQNKDKINKVDELIGIQETVLNLIQEQDNEINKYLEIITNKVIETAKDDLLTEKNIELEKKDKIIDELAKAFKQDDVRSVEEIKRFYERKVEDESDDKSTYGK